MSERAENAIADMLSEDPLIDAAVARAAREAVRNHAQAGRAVAEGRDQRVVWIAPQDMLARLAAEPEANAS